LAIVLSGLRKKFPEFREKPRRANAIFRPRYYFA